VFAIIGLFGYWGLNASLSRATEASISPYSGVIQMSSVTANITITLP
jgi:hypothetical protein